MLDNGVTYSSIYASVPIAVGRGSVVATIAGGVRRSVLVSVKNEIDASASFDEDYPSLQNRSSGPGALSYTWLCSIHYPERLVTLLRLDRPHLRRPHLRRQHLRRRSLSQSPISELLLLLQRGGLSGRRAQARRAACPVHPVHLPEHPVRFAHLCDIGRGDECGQQKPRGTRALGGRHW